jgi:hypothetical protein
MKHSSHQIDRAELLSKVHHIDNGIGTARASSGEQNEQVKR